MEKLRHSVQVALAVVKLSTQLFEIDQVEEKLTEPTNTSSEEEDRDSTHITSALAGTYVMCV